MKKIKRIAIITGVTSFLGRSTAKKLIACGFVVFGIVRPDSKRMEGLDKIKGLTLIELDFDKYKMSDFNCLKPIDKKNVDITFIHFAWGATLDRNNLKLQMENVEYSKKVLNFARGIGAKRFIFAGSQAEMSDSAYGIAKKDFADKAIDILKNTDIRFIHMRIFSIYGREDRETSLLKTLVNSIKNNIDIDLSTCDFDWNFLYIDDLTEMIYRLIKYNAKTGTYDMASDDTRLLKDYIVEAHKVLKGRNKLNFGKRPVSKEKFSLPDIGGTIEVIGDINFTSFKKGIKNI